MTALEAGQLQLDLAGLTAAIRTGNGAGTIRRAALQFADVGQFGCSVGPSDNFEVGFGTSPTAGTPPPSYDPAVTPNYGDLNSDNSHDLDDVQLLAQQIVDGSADLDINDSGATNVEDVTAYALFASGQSPILK